MIVDGELNTLTQKIGRRIAELRSARELTLEQLAAAAGFTKGYLSKIEKGKAVPPIGTLIRIAQGLHTEISDLLDAGDGQDAGEICVVRSWQHQPVACGKRSFGYDYIALAQRRHHKRMEPFVLVFPTKGDKDLRFNHKGEEFMFILAGEVEFEVELGGRKKTWVLTKGDCVYFNSEIPHRGRGLTSESSALIVVYREEPDTV